MSWFGTISTVIDVLSQAEDAVTAAEVAYKAGRPLTAVVDAFAAKTVTPIDDDVIAWIKTAIEQVIDTSITVTSVASRLGVLALQVKLRAESLRGPEVAG